MSIHRGYFLHYSGRTKTMYHNITQSNNTQSTISRTATVLNQQLFDTVSKSVTEKPRYFPNFNQVQVSKYITTLTENILLMHSVLTFLRISRNVNNILSLVNRKLDLASITFPSKLICCYKYIVQRHAGLVNWPL